MGQSGQPVDTGTVHVSVRDVAACCLLARTRTPPLIRLHAARFNAHPTNTTPRCSARKNRKQATKALTKEAKRVKTFLLQQAIRKSKAAAEKKASKTKKAGEVDGGRGTEEEEGEEEATPCPADGDASGGLAASSQEVLLIKVQ